MVVTVTHIIHVMQIFMSASEIQRQTLQDNY